MKTILLTMLTLFATAAQALEAGDITLQFAGGARNLYGIYGLSFERMIAQKQSIHIGLGLDFIGPVKTLGYHYFHKVSEDKTSGLYNLFFYGGLALQNASAVNIGMTDKEISSTYELGERYYLVPNIGIRKVFRTDFTMDLNLSYKQPLSSRKITNVYGPDIESQKQDIRNWEQGPGIGVAFGYTF